MPKKTMRCPHSSPLCAACQQVLDSMEPAKPAPLGQDFSWVDEVISTVKYSEKGGICDQEAYATIKRHFDALAALAHPSTVRGYQMGYAAAKRELEEERKDKILQYRSFCGCPMCEHHTSAYKLNHENKSL